MSRRAIAWGPAVLWALGLSLLSEVRDVPAGLQPFSAIPDKLVHFVLYLALGVLLARARRLSGVEVRHAVLLGIGFAYAALDEWHQSFVPGRTPELADWLADVSGLALGYLIISFARSERFSRTRRVGE